MKLTPSEIRAAHELNLDTESLTCEQIKAYLANNSANNKKLIASGQGDRNKITTSPDNSKMLSLDALSEVLGTEQDDTAYIVKALGYEGNGIPKDDVHCIMQLVDEILADRALNRSCNNYHASMLDLAEYAQQTGIGTGQTMAREMQKSLLAAFVTEQTSFVDDMAAFIHKIQTDTAKELRRNSMPLPASDLLSGKGKGETKVNQARAKLNPNPLRNLNF